METVEIASKGFLLKYLHVKGGQTVTWQVRPTKHSLYEFPAIISLIIRNVGIYRHPETLETSKDGLTSREETSNDFGLNVNSLGTNTNEKNGVRPRQLSTTNIPCRERLKAAGLHEIEWYGKCEAEKVASGRFTVLPGMDGIYSLCFGMHLVN